MLCRNLWQVTQVGHILANALPLCLMHAVLRFAECIANQFIYM
jgi:hypothetical protein